MPRPFVDGALLVGDTAGMLNPYAPEGDAHWRSSPACSPPRPSTTRLIVRAIRIRPLRTLGAYQTRVEGSWLKRSRAVYAARNFHQGFKRGLIRRACSNVGLGTITGGPWVRHRRPHCRTNPATSAWKNLTDYFRHATCRV